MVVLSSHGNTRTMAAEIRQELEKQGVEVTI
jgi:flavodoxin